MKTIFLSILCAVILAAPATAQTIKSLGYNTTNGQIVAATNAVWTNAFSFSTNTVAAQVRTNLLLGWSALTNTNSANFRSAIGLGTFNSVVFDSLSLAGALTATNGVYFSGGASILGGGSLDVRSPGNTLAASFSSTNGQIFGNLTVLGSMSVTNSAQTRTNLGLGWSALTNTNSTNFRSAVGLGLAALTNTSNVTAMRALSGSTNTNQPFSGQFNVIDDNSITFTIVVSNGIIVSATEY